MNRAIRSLVGLMLLLGIIASAEAHKASDSFLRLNVDGSTVNGRWDIALRDLDFAIGLDRDADGAITWGEVRKAEAAIDAYALSRLKLSSDNRPCTLEATPGLQIAEHSDGRYAVLSLKAACPQTPAKLGIAYSLLFDIDAQHRGLLNLSLAGQTQTGVFGPDRGTQSFESGRRPMSSAPIWSKACGMSGPAPITCCFWPACSCQRYCAAVPGAGSRPSV